MELMQARRRLMMSAIKKFEDEYTIVPYITNTDGAYIDTGFILSNNSDVKIVSYTNVNHSLGSNNFVFGAMHGNNGSTLRFGMWEGRGTVYFYYDSYSSCGHTIARNQSPFTIGYHTIRLNKDGIWVDDTYVTQTRTNTGVFTLPGSAYIFAIHKTDDDTLFTGTSNMSQVEIIDGAKKMSLVTCIRKSDNEPGMYDTVSKTFYTNAGTGEFIIPN